MKNIKHSNRGGALLSVVIVMAIAGILGALAISIAYTNFTMKVVDKKSKDNFYSAEKVLEEICVGLEKEASDHYKEAYTYVMSKYNEYNDVTTMEEEFATMFVVGLIEDIQVTGNSGKWLIGNKAAEGGTPTGLYRFVKDNYGTADYTITAETNANVIDTLEDGLCLRNVNVKYQDGNYHNTITTDIKISIPDVSFAMISAMPEIGEYSYIAEGGTVVAGSAGVKLVGKAYNGIGPNVTTNTNKTAITLNSGSTFDASNTNSVLLVSKGDIDLKGTSTFKTGEKTALWTESITANYVKDGSNRNAGNLVDLQGRVYVKDDTTLNGTNNTLKLAGQYYGYSNKDDDAGLSSALIINGHNTSIDMSKLDTLLIAGTSFVGTTSSDNDYASQNEDILMGDSVAIKSNQLAYLVPTECEGIVTNPMTYAQYETLVATTGWKQKALDTYLPTIRNSLSNYGNVDIVEAFSNDGTVYLYLNFASSAKAGEYFMSYYGANKTQVDAFINNYLQAITFKTTANDLTRVVTQGNYLKATTTTGLKAEYATSTGDVSSTAQELANYHSSYSALCRKLITNESALTDTERTNTVYQNLVNETVLKNFVAQVKAAGASNLSSNISVSGNVVTIDGDALEAIIVDNANETSPYVVSSQHNKGILIATGDVQISGSAAATDWDGLIICGGKLTVTGGTCDLKHNPDYIGKVMQLSCEVKVDGNMVPYDVLDFFTSGSNYSSSSSSDGLTLTDVRNCISYENYKSE